METVSKTDKHSHTAGPWQAVLSEDERWEVLKKEKYPGWWTNSKMVIASDISQGPSDGEADAKLVAAAPELLEALKIALWAEENGEVEAQKQGRPRLIERREIMRSAIKKATE